MVVGREGGHRVESIVVDQRGIERGEDLGIAETHEGRLASGNHHLSGHFGIRVLARVGSQDLQPLGIHVRGVGRHRNSSRIRHRPGVIQVNGIHGRQAVADGLGDILIEQFLVRAA